MSKSSDPFTGEIDLADVSTETIRKAGPLREEVFRLALARSA